MISSEEEPLAKQEKEEELVSGKDEEEGPICRLSQPAYPHTLSLSRRTKIKTWLICFASSDGTKRKYEDEFHYYCTTCDVEFHEWCYLWPRKMTHPYHPQHSLVLSARSRETGFIYDFQRHKSYDEEFQGVDILDRYPGNIFDNCTWCGGATTSCYINFYRCSICNFCLCSNCSKTFALPTIQNPKSHHHSLIFLPRPLLIPCDACGLVERSEPSYACFQCNFLVHRNCADLPRVIKLTRHPHRLFYTPFLSPTISSCRLCYKTVDVKYGHYSCNHQDCSYVVHSICATHKKVWDGRELEWEPVDEFGETEDVAPFKKVGDDLIKYFCHEHHLRLEKYDGVRDAVKQCQACTLHIDSRDFYNCVQCEFFLHEVCANLPRKLDHALHNHPLFLDPAPSQEFEAIGCLVCSRGFAGFRYKCSKNNCEAGDRFNPKKFQVDVGCILIPECFTHKSHEHPLFIPIPDGNKKIRCEGCKGRCDICYLQCTICQYVICYRCATIPDKLHYKYDALPLSLCYGEVSDETYWCELCEKKLDPSEWFYTCNKPYITIHRECVFGALALMKPGYILCYKSFSVKIICNDSNTRPICHKCNSRCTSSVYFKWFDGMVNCSFHCLSRGFRGR